MSGSMAVNVLIGAGLAGSFGATIQSALARVGALAGAGDMLAGAISGAARLEQELMATGITADMSDEQVRNLRASLRALAVPESTNQSVDNLQGGFNALVSAGMEARRAEESLYAIGRTATATGASVEDLSKTAYVLVETLGVAPKDLTAELDRLAFAGKAGAFELKDMAQYFPMLGAGAKNLGLKGSEAVGTMAAALQIAKRGAGDPSEAANNMANFMKALTSPLVLKNAKKAGINIKAILKKAWAEGENPFTAVMEALHAKLGNDPFKIGEIFQDAQVQNFLKPMLADFEDFKKLKADMDSQSAGSVDADYARMMSTAAQQMQGLANSVAMLGDSLGKALLPQTKKLLGVLTGIVGSVTQFTEANPELVVMAGHVMLSVAAFKALGSATAHGRGLLRGFTRSAGQGLQRLRADFQAAQAAAAAQPPLLTRVGNAFRMAGGAAVSLGGHVRGVGRSLASLPGRFSLAGGAATIFRGTLAGLRTGLIATRVGLLGVGRAIKGLFMTNPLGWLFAAVEFGSMMYDSWEPFRKIVDKIWSGIKKVGGAIAEFFGWGDDGEKEPEKKSAEKDPDSGDASKPTEVQQPGDAVARAEKNQAMLEARLAEKYADRKEPPREQKFSHEISVVLRVPEGFSAGQATHNGADGTKISLRTGQLMAGAN